MTPTSGDAEGSAHPVDLLDRPGLDLLRHAGGLDLLAQLVDLGLLRVVLAQLALDGLELLAQDVLALGLVHLGLDLGLDPALELEDLDLVREEGRDELEALDDVDRLEHLLALLGGHVRAVGDHVGQQPGLADVARGDRGLRRDRRAVGHVLLDLGLDRAHQRLDLEAVRALVGEFLDGRAEVRLGPGEAEDAQPALALDDRPDRPVLELHDLGDLGQRADGIELGGIVDVLLLGLALGDERDGPALGDRGVERVDALLAADLERDDHLGEDDRLRSATSGSSRGPGTGWAARRPGWTVAWPLKVLLDLRLRRGLGGWGLCGLPDVGPFGIEGFEDASAEALFEFEQDPDAGEVHAALPGEVTDPGDPPDIVLAIEADVGRRPGRAEQPLVLVDAKGPRMRADERRGHADDVDGALGIAFRADLGHIAC